MLVYATKIVISVRLNTIVLKWRGLFGLDLSYKCRYPNEMRNTAATCKK